MASVSPGFPTVKEAVAAEGVPLVAVAALYVTVKLLSFQIAYKVTVALAGVGNVAPAAYFVPPHVEPTLG